MATYEQADDATNERIQQIIERFHGPLHEAGVTVDCLFVHAKRDDDGDPTGPALKLHGVACAAIVKINSLKLRTQGHADAEIQIDGDRWGDRDEAEQDAILDHELQHLTIVPIGEGTNIAKRDDLGRPRLKMRFHDHEFGWFDAIVRRHGRSSLEWKQWETFEEDRVQLWLPFADNPESPKARPVRAPAKPPKKKDEGTMTVSIRGAKPVEMSVDKFVDHVEQSFGRGRAASKGGAKKK